MFLNMYSYYRTQMKLLEKSPAIKVLIALLFVRLPNSKSTDRFPRYIKHIVHDTSLTVFGLESRLECVYVMFVFWASQCLRNCNAPGCLVGKWVLPQK